VPHIEMELPVDISQVVGGSSCINGMFFDRGSRHDYDTWRRVSSPEFDTASDKWDWNGLSRLSPPETVDGRREADVGGWSPLLQKGKSRPSNVGGFCCHDGLSNRV